MGPQWRAFGVTTHAPSEAHLSGLYCLAAVAHWLHRLDAPKRPRPPNKSVEAIDSILKTMKAALPAEVPKIGLNHPEVPNTYKVPIEGFEKAWKAGATKTHKPWAVVVE